MAKKKKRRKLKSLNDDRLQARCRDCKRRARVRRLEMQRASAARCRACGGILDTMLE